MAALRDGRTSVRPSDVVELMRTQNDPVGIWYVLGEFSMLEKLELIIYEPDTATWQLNDSCSFSVAMRRYKEA